MTVSVLPLAGSGILNANMTALIFQESKFIYVQDSGKGLGDPSPKKRVIAPATLAKLPSIIPPFHMYDRYLTQGYKIRAVIITHIHGDHTGSIKDFMDYLAQHDQSPRYYLSRQVHVLLRQMKIRIPEESVQILVDRQELTTDEGVILRPIGMNHSTVGTMSLHYTHGQHRILYTPDFCVDYDPVHGYDQGLIQAELTRIGKQGLHTWICQSTLAAQGFDQMHLPPVSQAQICARVRSALRYYDKKRAGIVVSGFATNAVRTTQTIRQAIRMGRKVGLIGQNLRALVQGYFKLGYLDPSLRASIEDVSRVPNLSELKKDYVIVTSGHQGEYLAGLTRIARDQIPYKIGSHDVVLICSRTIPKPGPIMARQDMLNNLNLRRVLVVEKGLHKSGHILGGHMVPLARRLNPGQIVANHGDQTQMVGWYRIAVEAGIPHTRVKLAKSGQKMILTSRLRVNPAQESAG